MVVLSAAARFAQCCLPYRWTARYLGQHHHKTELCSIANAQQMQTAYRVSRFIDHVCERTLWQSQCLVRAMILRVYLERYQIPYVINVGLAKNSHNPEQPLLAHAWVSVGHIVVSGSEGYQDFTIISTYLSRKMFQYSAQS